MQKRIVIPNSKYLMGIAPIGAHDFEEFINPKKKKREAATSGPAPISSGLHNDTAEFMGDDQSPSHGNEGISHGDEDISLGGEDISLGGEDSDEEEEHYSEREDSDDDDEACNACGSTRGFRLLFMCSYCFEYVHLGCYNRRFNTSLTDIPGTFACQGQSCIDKYTALVKSNKIEDVLGLFSPTQAEDRADDIYDFANSDSDTECQIDITSDGDSHREPEIVIVGRKIQAIAATEPMAYASIREFCRSSKGMVPELYVDIGKGLKRLLTQKSKDIGLSHEQVAEISEEFHKARPPENIRRKMGFGALSPLRTQKFAKRFASKNIEARVTFSYRHPLDAAADLYFSEDFRQGGFLHDVRNRCSTGRMPDFESKLVAFGRRNNFDIADDSQLTFLLGLYTDESRSASGNVEFCPCWLYHVMTEPEYRFMAGVGAHALIALMPDSLSISYHFVNKEVGTPAAAEAQITKQQRREAALYFQKKALETLLKAIKEAEADGISFEFAGRTYCVRAIVTNYVSDMKERRNCLGMRGGAVYDCTKCYDFPGKDVPAPSRRGKRSVTTDTRIRKDFRDGRLRIKGKSANQQFKEDLGQTGIFLKDRCPFTASENANIFTTDGPYEIFFWDPLHNKDGVILYYTKFLQAYLGENTFIPQTQTFGNMTLLTGKFSMHVMELGIMSFHAIPLALYFGDFEHDLDDSFRGELFKGSCDLLEILSLLTDPCPAFVHKRLTEAIRRFELHVRKLLILINSSERGTNKLTPKMHELFVHSLEQVAIGGLPNAFSSKIFETFHERIKTLFQLSSKRRRDGSAAREIVECLFYQAVIGHVEQFIGDNQVQRAWKPYRYTSKFLIANADPKLPIEEMFQRNVKATMMAMFQLGVDAVKDIPTLPQELLACEEFGSTLNMHVRCSLRRKAMTQTQRCIVPGTSQGTLYMGGAFNVLAYQCVGDRYSKPAKPDFVHCADKGCTSRHHDYKFQLFCSAARDEDTAYAVPVLFARNTVFAWPLRRLSSHEEQGIPLHDALIEYVCDLKNIIAVNFESIRGPVVAKTLQRLYKDRRVFIYPGRNIFGYDS